MKPTSNVPDARYETREATVMEDRIARFIAALRAAGVRVSLAESQDAWQAIQHLGINDRDAFRMSLRATLVKDADAIPTFEELFPLYFGSSAPPLLDPQAELTPEQQQLLDWNQLQDVLDQLWEMLAAMGMDPATIEELQLRVADNQERLEKQIGEFAGQQLRDNMVEDAQRHKPIHDLMQRPFGSLNQREMDVLRDQVRRLAVRLRSRAALRQKRGKHGKLDPKATIRANLRYSGVPFEMRFKQRRRKPKLVTILDVSTSMRPVAEFFLRMLYELQDQIQKTRSFAFIDHLEDVTPNLATREIDEAVYVVLRKLPSGYYNTNLGYSLQQFEAEYMDTVDSRTTVIILGDGRNNYNDPNTETFSRISRRARRLIWMNPEYPAQWGAGDSDMLDYAPLCSDVYQVRNLAQLADAIDRILA
jgi:uncharacterized protein